ncbi:D-alanyl-D-alanine carboxypeptidase family protein [Moraxella bovis]|nr:D-alanyl-D-alanine carboxypeptidase family protein [Moraxella bovis]
MTDLGNFMKKRTRDLLIGAGLLGVGTVGAIAMFTNNQSGSGYIASPSKNTVHVISQPTNPTAIADQSGRSYTGYNQNQPTHHQHQSPQAMNQGPAYQVEQGNFNTPTPQYDTNAIGSICAPEALKVGIKHFRYADADPSDLVPSGYGSDPKFKIHRAAKPALQEMIKAARADGVTLTPGSILRTSSRQAQIVANKKKQGQSAKQIYHTSSHPGYSEHHTGLAVDFSPIDHSFAKTAGYRWLQQHAHEYGFYQTFTPDYSRYSGVSEESWHWRFEGKNKEFSYVFADSINRRC